MKTSENNQPKEYRVQAILIDVTGESVIETIIDSFLTTDYKRTLDTAMKRHKTVTNTYILSLILKRKRLFTNQKKTNIFCGK